MRKQNACQSEPITLKERRVADRAAIQDLIKANKPLLVHWDTILAAALDGKQPRPFVQIRAVDDFIDGFQVVAPDATKS